MNIKDKNCNTKPNTALKASDALALLIAHTINILK